MLTIIVDVFNIEIEDGVPIMSCLLDVAFVEVHLEFWGVGGVDNLASLVLFYDVCILLGNLVWRSYLINDFQFGCNYQGVVYCDYGEASCQATWLITGGHFAADFVEDILWRTKWLAGIGWSRLTIWMWVKMEDLGDHRC